MIKKVVKKIINYSLSPFLLGDWLFFKKLDDKRFAMPWSLAYPCLLDKTIRTGFERHYVYHTSWAARKVAQIKPEFHIDISSSLYFAGIVSAFVPVKFYDYRPADLRLSNLESLKADILSLPFADNSVKSLSCMHVVEHIGLGRYGDEIDPDGDKKAISELKRVLALGGDLLFVVPVGNQAVIQYNAHRIYTYDMIMEYFSDLQLKEFSLIPENHGSMIINATKEDVTKEFYGCGCFWFAK